MRTIQRAFAMGDLSAIEATSTGEPAHLSRLSSLFDVESIDAEGMEP